MRRWDLRVIAALVAIPLADQGIGGQQQTVFRSSVDRVRVDVVVTDDRDRPISGLTQNDFSISQDGKPQTITDFRFVSVPLDRRQAPRTASSVSRLDAVSNVPASETGRLWVIIVDDLHLIEADIVPVKRILAEVVQSLRPDDEVALVYTGRSDLSVNFTVDSGRLFQAIERVRDAVGFGLDALPRLAQLDARYVRTMATRATDTIRNVTRSLAGSPHPRRAVVYVGTMTTIDPESAGGAAFIADELQKTFEHAKRSNVPIYTVDPRGTVVPEEAVRGGTGVITSERIRREIEQNVRSQKSWLTTLAINTGGRAFANNSDVVGAAKAIVEENSSFYELAFSPEPLVRDGRFHAIDVKVNRPGARVRARRGYVAPGRADDTASLMETLDAAMASAINVSGLWMRAVAIPLTAATNGMTTAVTIEVAYPAPADGSARIDDTLALRIYALDAEAKLKAHTSRELRFGGAAPSGNQPLSFLIDEAIDVPSQPVTLRIGIASTVLGRAGTVQLPVENTGLNDRLSLSGIAIGAVGRELPALNSSSIASLVPFQPVTARSFAPSDTLRVFGRAFWRSGAEPAMTIGIVGASAQATRLTVSNAGSQGMQGVFDASIPLKDLKPGEFVLEVMARQERGALVTRRVPFTVR